MRRAAVRRAALWVPLVLTACGEGEGGDDGASVSIELFSAHFRSENAGPTPLDLRSDPSGTAGAEELEVVVASPDPDVQLRTELFPLFDDGGATGSGRLPDLSLDQPQQIFVRGFPKGGNEPRLFGASDVFTIGDGDRRLVGIQIGRADCVGLNAAPATVTGPRGSIDMIAGRVGSSMTMLPDGRVLVIGGARIDGQGQVTELLDTMEIYDPNQGEFFEAEVRLLEPRAHHTATHLGDGRVLVFGGQTTDTTSGMRRVAREALVVDLGDVDEPVRRVAGVLGEGLERYQHEATIIRANTGETSVLFTGGLGPDDKPQATTVRFFPGETDDPARGEFVPQGPLCDARAHHSATALVGRAGELAVVAGGLRALEDGTLEPLRSIEVFSVNPSQECVCADRAKPQGRFGCFVKPARIQLEEARWGHRSLRVDDDRQVLFVGGYAKADRSEFARGLEALDAQLQMHGPDEMGSLPRGIGDFSATAMPVDFFSDGPAEACNAPTAGGVCRPEHQVVITGGRRGDAPVAEVLRLVPRRERDAETGALALRGFRVKEIEDACGLSEPRFGHQAVRLRTGTLLLGGGIIGPNNNRAASRRAEIFFPLASNVRALFPSEASLTARPVP